MGGDSRVRHLLEEILDTERSPEEVCRNCAELLPQVREGLRRLRLIEAQVGTLFPETVSTSSGGSRPAAQPPAEFPRITGYDVQALLGHGGMGVVYKAWDLRLKRPVAIKMLLVGAYARPEERERFFREAEAAAGLRHPNIVPVYDVGDHEGRPYFTMEFVEGGSLAQQLGGNPLPVRRAATLVATLAGAVEVAHQGGIIHRDLKPANVLLTAEGTPKVSDFGLARRLEGGAALTLSGSAVGTPSYMAPEQAQGKTRAIGPALDIYSLGAMLYELLTGQPPFRAETASEMVLLLISQDPVPPSRLNAKVPRDIETICMKCLEKDPSRRYATAGELAADLGRFLNGEPVKARPVGAMERSLRWVRRRPSQATLLAGTTVLAISLIGGGSWFLWQRTATVHAVEKELREAARLQQESAWAGAGAALERAVLLLGQGGPTELHHRLDRARRELQLEPRLEAIHMTRLTLVEGRFNYPAEVRFNNAQADRGYESAFREAGLGKVKEDPASVADRVMASGIRGPLVAALDDWAVCAREKDRQEWLLKVARRADEEIWRDRVRDPAAWRNRAALVELAQTAPLAHQPVEFSLAVGERLQASGEDAIGYLSRVQQEHPNDFWINLTLGNAWRIKDPAEGIRYYRAALSARPEAVVVYNNLGVAFIHKYLLQDAFTNFRQAMRIDPKYAPALSNFGLALKAKGTFVEAADYYRDALRIDHKLAPTHYNLGEILAIQGAMDQAIEHYREASEIDPAFAPAEYSLGIALLAKGRFNEAAERDRKARRSASDDVGTHDWNLGLALDDALDHYHQSLGFDASWTPADNDLVSISPGQDRLSKVIDHFRQALRSDPELALAHGALGQVLLAQGHFSEAQAATRRCLDLIPKTDWRHRNLTYQMQRCERLLALAGRLPALLQGKDRPADAAESLHFAELCRIKRQFAAAAGLFADALAKSPPWPDDLHASFRYNAPSAAILAGSGRGENGFKLSEAEQARWRKQAREWLQADLAAWARNLDHGPPADRLSVIRILTHWRADPDMAGLRDPDALDKMPMTESQECRKLSSDLDTLLTRLKNLK